MAIDLNLITDTALRDQLISLGITIPHANSVINAGLFDYNDQFYYKLLAMEAYTYTNSSQPADPNDPLILAGVAEYQPYWTAYNSALMLYVNHAPLSLDTLNSFFQGYYSFLSMYLTKNLGDVSTYTNSNVNIIFDVNGLTDTVAGYALDYYDDFIVGDPLATPDPIVETSPNLESDTAFLATAWDVDAGKVSGLISQYVTTVLNESTQALFGNPTPAVATVTSQEMWDAIFDISGWESYITNSGSTFNVPPRPA